jgi:uncharacterized membrane protein (Fun14 family)
MKGTLEIIKIVALLIGMYIIVTQVMNDKTKSIIMDVSKSFAESFAKISDNFVEVNNN